MIPLLFPLYVNDLPNAISDLSTPTLYADDTSLLITNSDSQMFENDINTVLAKLSTRFHSNLLLLNLEKLIFCNLLLKTQEPWTYKCYVKINKY
jgi:hypothetical protein